MTFPYDFGFIPQTRGEDGDPLDVLLLMDAPAFAGCVVFSRLIGIIQARQTERDGKAMRNDRILAVRVDDRIYGNCKEVKQLNRGRVEEITGFFATYNQLQDKSFKVLSIRGAAAATAAVRQGMREFAKPAKA